MKYTVVYIYFSLPRARERLCHARQYRDLPEAQKLSRLQKAHRSASSITSFGSQVGDTRPLSSCNFSPNSGIVQLTEMYKFVQIEDSQSHRPEWSKTKSEKSYDRDSHATTYKL